ARSGDGVLQKLRTRNPDLSYNKEEKQYSAGYNPRLCLECGGCEIDGVHVECSFSTRVAGGKVQGLPVRGSASRFACLFCSEPRLKTLETLEKRGRFAQIVRSLKAYYAWQQEHPAVYEAAMDRITRWVPELKDHFEDKVKHKPPASDQLREFMRNNLVTFRARSGDGVLQKLRTRNPDLSYNKEEKRYSAGYNPRLCLECEGCEIDGVHVECSFSTCVPGGKVQGVPVLHSTSSSSPSSSSSYAVVHRRLWAFLGSKRTSRNPLRRQSGGGLWSGKWGFGAKM
ncbi:MAG: hypothetical protein MK077_10950, partial [Phycisphaerales bacterium]|nr:hypothetical protein [Phycisphaerales bacterium]